MGEGLRAGAGDIRRVKFTHIREQTFSFGRTIAGAAVGLHHGREPSSGAEQRGGRAPPNYGRGAPRSSICAHSVNPKLTLFAFLAGRPAHHGELLLKHVVLFLSLTWALSAQAAPISAPNTFADGDVISAETMNANFTAVVEGVNTQDEAMSAMLERFATLEAAQQTTQDALDAAEARIDLLESASDADLSAELQALTNRVTALESAPGLDVDLAALDVRVMTLEGASALDSDLDALDIRVTTLEGVSPLNGDLDALEDRVIVLESAPAQDPDLVEQINALVSVDSEHDTQITSLEEQIAAESVPAGTIAAFAAGTIPEGWLLCNGRTISSENYPDLVNNIGDLWGDAEDNDPTTVNIPDLRDEFLRGAGPDRDVGSYQADQNQEHSHAFYVRLDSEGPFAGMPPDYPVLPHLGHDAPSLLFNKAVGDQGGEESRPRNFAVTYLIKY